MVLGASGSAKPLRSAMSWSGKAFSPALSWTAVDDDAGFKPSSGFKVSEVGGSVVWILADRCVELSTGR